MLDSDGPIWAKLNAIHEDIHAMHRDVRQIGALELRGERKIMQGEDALNTEITDVESAATTIEGAITTLEANQAPDQAPAIARLKAVADALRAGAVIPAPSSGGTATGGSTGSGAGGTGGGTTETGS